MSAIRILLVEDSEDDAALLAASLRERGLDVTLERVDAAKGMSAALAAGGWDIVVSDYSLPSFDAKRALALFKGSGLDAPFVVISGVIGEERATEIVRAGANDFVLKGNYERVGHVIERELREAAERRALGIAEAKLKESEQRRREGEEANRLKDEFLATVSHELRTPLNAILGWAVFAQETSDKAEIARALEVIERNARAQARIIEDMFDVSRVMSGKLRMNIVSADIARVIGAAVDAVAPAAAAKGIELRAAVAPGIGFAAADPDRLQQIAWNLLANAVKFTPKGGHVAIEARRDESQIVIVVRDDGPGIPLDFLPFVFEPFRQADASPTRAHGGLGLGLSIVKQLVLAHGGTVRAESAGPSRGASFVVELPIRAAPALVSSSGAERVGADAPAGDLGRLDGLRLVVVDDEQDARELLEKTLTSLGAVVHTAGSAADALRLIERVRPDVLLSDIAMPGLDGYGLIHAVRDLKDGLGRTPAIALTAYTRPEDVERAVAAGFQAHCSKPCEPATLASAVRSVSGRA